MKILNFTAGASVAKYTATNDIAGLTGMTINITDAVATAGSDEHREGRESQIHAFQSNTSTQR